MPDPFWDDLNGRMEDPKFRRSYVSWSLRLQGATRWQVFKYRIRNWRNK